MKQETAIQRLCQWYQQRPLRERVMLLLGLLVVLFFVWDSLLMTPLSARKKNLQSQQRQLQMGLAELASRQQLVQVRKDYDPDREDRARLDSLQRELEQVRGQLGKGVASLISPRELPELLKQLLQRQKKLRLLSLENLPAEPLQVDEQLAEEPLAPALYRHRLRMEFAGDYLTTLAYLKAIQDLPRRLVWEELEIETEAYPEAKVLLQVYTLSLNEGWIGG